MVEQYDPVELNLSVFENINLSEINGIVSSPGDIPVEIINSGNEITGGLVGFFILTAIGIYLLYKLSSKSGYDKFNYSYLRGLCISLGVVTILAIQLIQTGFIQDFIAASVFFMLFVISFIIVTISNKS